MKRAIIRDNDLFGGTENVIKLYEKRYIPGQELYLKLHDPIHSSDIVLNNNDYRNPIVTRISRNLHHRNLYHIRNSLAWH